ncbi:MAG: type I-E CRISPR-associated protein Cas6/Cse3/CasE [Hyphomicrobiales bacterium]|nr:type I-E CRISPR-associated protein Cas6/Cse3/CasE [Hyphomicrobiales bacterium]
MTLYMLRLNPDLRRANAWGAAQRLAPPGADSGYLWHALLTAAFGDLAPKPWRLVEPPRAAAHLLAYARADAAALAERAALYADPAVAAALGVDTLAAKRMPDVFRAGQKLGFDVRLRPVVRSSFRLDGSGRAGRDQRIEIDAALHASLLARESDAQAPRADAETIYKTWLAQRLATGGARAEEACMKLLWRRRSALVRRDAARRIAVHGRKGGGPDVALSGVLEVAEPQAFANMLAQGVGRHRAFGFGMILLRPV